MGVARAYRSIGEAYAYMDQYEEGLNYLKLFRDISKSEQNEVELQRALTAIGWCHLEFGKFVERQWEDEGKIDDSKKEKYQGLYTKSDKFSRHAFTSIPEEVNETCPDKEIKEMKTAVLMNRGCALMALKKFELADNCFVEACDITKCYSALFDKYYVSLLVHRTSTSMKQMKYSDALKLNKNVMNTLEKLPIPDNQKQQIHTEALYQKIQALLGLRQFQQAKKLCKSLFIKNSGNVDEILGRWLKNIVRICRLMEDINKKAIRDTSLIKTYERIGDLCVNLERYDTANFYYEKAVDIAGTMEVQEQKLLGGLYFSIAENYLDLESYEMAEIFYAKKLEMCRQDAKESCQITLRLANCAHRSGKGIDKICFLLDEARKLAVRSGRNALEARVLQLTYNYQLRLESSSCDISKQELERFLQQYQLDPNDLELEDNDQEELVSESSEELNLDALSEDDDSDNELKCLGNAAIKSGRKRGSFKHTTNSKGETDLHVKCQEEGNIEAIQTLIKMGHELNIADRAKFTPIHEACNYGFLDYVKQLHSSGAKLNLKSNSGVTPLITACSNGSIDIIEFLVDSGALVHIQEECGWTAKDHLVHFIRTNRADIDPDIQERYKAIIKKMDIGIKGHELLPKKTISTVFETEGEQSQPFLQNDILLEIENESSKKTRLPNSRRKRSDNRQKTDFRNTVEVSSSQGSPNLETSSSIKSYVDAVSSVKKRSLVQSRLRMSPLSKENMFSTQPASYKRPNNSSRNNFIEDNWLEDDMPKEISKSIKGSKGNSRSQEQFKDTKRQRLGTEPKSRPNSIQERQTFNKFLGINSHIIDTNLDNEPAEPYPITSTQLSGRTLEVSTVNLQEDISIVQPLTQQPDPIFSRITPPVTNPSNVLRFSVQIEQRRLLIPIQKENRVFELSKAILNRYSNSNEITSSTGRMPVIRLLDNEGCELDDGDLLEDLFGTMASEPIRLQCRVEKWELEKVEILYEKLCQDMNMTHLTDVKGALLKSQQTTHLNLNKSLIRSQSSHPLFRALRFRSILTEVNLAGNKLGIAIRETINREDSSLKSMEELGGSLRTLNSLIKLDLSSNALQSRHLETFYNALFQSSTDSTHTDSSEIKLREINLGFNFLGDDCDTILISILDKCSHLETICISSCGLSKYFFLRSYTEWENVFTNRCSIKNLDISHNPKLGVVGIDKMLQLLNTSVVITINISTCCNSLDTNEKCNLGEAIFKYASRGRPDIALQELNIGGNHNVDLEDFCNSLYHMSHLKKLNLSYCGGLSLEFVDKLFEEFWTQSSDVEEIQILSNNNLWNISSCESDILQRIATNIKYLASKNSLRLIEISPQNGVSEDDEFINKIVITWQDIYKEVSKIERNGKKLRFSIIGRNI